MLPPTTESSLRHPEASDDHDDRNDVVGAIAPAPPAIADASGPAPRRFGRTRIALRVAGVAGAATAGTLAGFGLRRDGVIEPFALVGRLLLGAASTEGGLVRPATVVAGLAVHLLVVAAWAVLFTRLAGVGRRRPLEVPPVVPRVVIAAAVTGLTAWIADSRILPPMLQIGYGAGVYGPQSWLLHAVLSGALVLGMRIAPPARRDDDS